MKEVKDSLEMPDATLRSVGSESSDPALEERSMLQPLESRPQSGFCVLKQLIAGVCIFCVNNNKKNNTSKHLLA